MFGVSPTIACCSDATPLMRSPTTTSPVAIAIRTSTRSARVSSGPIAAMMSRPGSHGALRVILVRAGIAEIGEYAVADKPGDAAVVIGNDPRAGGPIGADHLPHVLGIKASRELSRAYQIAEHHGEVASLGITPVNLLGDQLWPVEFGDRAQHLAAMAEQDSESIEVLVRQFGKDT